MLLRLCSTDWNCSHPRNCAAKRWVSIALLFHSLQSPPRCATMSSWWQADMTAIVAMIPLCSLRAAPSWRGPADVSCRRAVPLVPGAEKKSSLQAGSGKPACCRHMLTFRQVGAKPLPRFSKRAIGKHSRRWSVSSSQMLPLRALELSGEGEARTDGRFRHHQCESSRFESAPVKYGHPRIGIGFFGAPRCQGNPAGWVGGFFFSLGSSGCVYVASRLGR